MDPTAAMRAPGPAAPPGPAHGGLWPMARGWRVLQRWLDRWRAARAIVRAEAELRVMDPRIRRDLGLGDGEARAAARHGRGCDGGGR